MKLIVVIIKNLFTEQRNNITVHDFFIKVNKTVKYFKAKLS